LPRAKGDAAKAAPAPAAPDPDLPRIDYEDDASIDPTKVGAVAPEPVFQVPTSTIVCDDNAEEDEPTQARALILVSATAQTDKGRRRKNNEDSLLVDAAQSLFVVADGMGGYRGGEIASALAVQTIGNAFSTQKFDGAPHEHLPPRASEMARALQMANVAIKKAAEADDSLRGMGTTVVAARFSPNKQRLYIGHIGDSRLYRFRNGELTQLTVDHTMKQHGVKGAEAAHLSRAVGVWPVVPVDVLLAKPLQEDVYLLCSDGLTKMVTNEAIAEILTKETEPQAAVDQLVALANKNGGLDNITTILVRVTPPL
jgi:protein phosphatase